MKKLITVALSLMFVVCLSYTAVAGSLDSPGAPSAGSGMYTLQNLYDYLTSGAALTVQTSFQEPTSGPTSGTMKTTKQIGDAVATPFALCATTTAGNVESGKPFFCTQPGSWGVQTGTLVVPPTPTPTPTMTPTPTTTSTPTKTWYEEYGPSGTGDVVKIGTTYVASKKDGLGCNGGVVAGWASNNIYAEGLNWLGKDDWRMPTLAELRVVCLNKGSLASYTTDDWTIASTQEQHSPDNDMINFKADPTPGCDESYDLNTKNNHIRCVRNVP
ncbi:MAG: hypothetical protein NTZ78_02425 [Candidatus Aureabacteria bacterium]|nr:hypothetical protein [Candidatus Auribacterota bacterium]